MLYRLIRFKKGNKKGVPIKDSTGHVLMFESAEEAKIEGSILRSSDGDGVHLDATEHEKLAKAVADRIIGWSEKD